MLYLSARARIAAAITLGGMMVAPLMAQAEQLTVGPLAGGNTYATVEAAFADAEGGDTIVLDEAGSPYVLTAELVVVPGKSPLTIQGQFSDDERPDEIVIEGVSTGPAITVENNAELTLQHLTVTGGTTGVQVLTGSRLSLERVYVRETGAEGISVTGATSVDVTSSIFYACGAEGIVVNSGTVDVAQSTFIENTDHAIRLVGGTCDVGASYFYNNNGSAGAEQLSASATGLAIDYCGLVQGTVDTDVTETNPITDPSFLDPENLLFDAASPWRGAVLLPVLTGADTATIDTEAPFGRDFLYMARSTSDCQLGAHEFGAVATGAVWVDCVVTQFDSPAEGLVGLGTVNIALQVAEASLVGAKLYLVPEAPRGDVLDLNRFIPIEVLSSNQNSNFGTASIVLTDPFMATPGGADLLLDGRAELYLQMPGATDNVFPGVVPTIAFGTGYNATQIEDEAQDGRFFVIDTLPPIITGFREKRADDYVVSHTDGANDIVPDVTGGVLSVPWSAVADAPLASSAGTLDGESGSADPHVFFNENINGTINFTIEMEFTDSNVLIVDGTSYPISETGGFQAAPPSQSATGPGPISALLQNPAETNQPTAGIAWWDEVKPVPADATTQLTITYTGGGRDVGGNSLPLVVSWAFTGVPTAGAAQFWEAVAQFGVEDLVGNETGAATSSNPYRYSLNPFHIWQLYDVQGTLSGPSGTETTSPVLNWGVRRFSGVSPQNTDQAYPICQYAVYYHDSSTNPYDTGWQVAGAFEWSDWIATRRIDKFTRFRASNNTVLGDLIQQPNRMYMVVVRTADEAGNVVDLSTYPGIGTLNLGNINPLLPADTWVNGGPAISLDTRVVPTFWHNRPGSNMNIADLGEKVFGTATQIPLPNLDFCERVEAGFTITMDLPDSTNLSQARVAFDVFEDGRYAVGGLVNPTAAVGYSLLIPQHILPATQPAWVVLTDGDLLFLNESACGDRDKLGDDGLLTQEPPARQRNVKYTVVFSTGVLRSPTADPTLRNSYIFDSTPATVDFTVTVDRGLKEDQPVKRFVKE